MDIQTVILDLDIVIDAIDNNSKEDAIKMIRDIQLDLSVIQLMSNDKG